MSSHTMTTAEDYRIRARRRDTMAIGVIGLASLLLAAMNWLFPPGWVAALASGFVVFVVATWYRPVFGVGTVLALSIFFEEYEFASFRPEASLVPFFQRMSNFTGIGSLVISPLEILILTVCFVLGLRILVKRQPLRPNSLAAPLALFVGCLAMWLVYGMLRGGSGNVALWELRGFVYLSVLAVLVPQAIEDQRDARALIWVGIIGVAVKALQGVWAYVFILNGDTSVVRSVTPHEDALFIAWMFVLLGALLTYGGDKWQRIALLAATPMMLIAFVATDRRAAYVALAFGVGILLLLIATDTMKRRALVRAWLPFVAALLVFLAVSSVLPGPLGRPGEAVRSAVDPATTEDVRSSYYRRVEEFNLVVTIRSSPFMGLGFGRPLQAPEELAEIDFSLADYIPHNEILWVWAKMGTLGFALFWVFVGTVIAYGVRDFRRLENHYFKALAATVTAAVCMQLVVSYVDLQLTFARNMVFLGVLVGVLACLQRLDVSEAVGADA